MINTFLIPILSAFFIIIQTPIVYSQPRCFTREWGSFVEVYGNSQKSIVSVFADAGLAYSYNKDL